MASRTAGNANPRSLLTLLLFSLLWLFASSARAEVAIPPLQSRVTDQTGTLDATQRAALERKLAAFEQAKGSQIAVLIVASTEPEAIEQYSIRVAEQWKLGRKGVDDGILLLVARNDRTLRIDAGYGLEGVVPDAIANRIIDEIIVPHFRDGDYYAGIDAGVDRLIALIDGEPLPPPPPRQQRALDGDKLEAMVPLLFFALFASQFLRRAFGTGIGSLLSGGGVFVLVWLMSGALVFAIFLGVVALVLTLLGISPPIGGGSSRGGGFRGGGGGFSGGGGGFGGGGASGRW